ncbi:MAG: hypothetical protein K0S65_3296, partial [Labilithrix sp.]|nr:hypothetical protein [Labilithrix sp.]
TIGRTNTVSTVAETRPPMTTVASGRCTSLPGAVDSAIGKKPNDATSAVMSTGRRRSSAARMIAASCGTPDTSS